MITILFFTFITYTLSFAVVYKQPKIVKPIIFIFENVGLKQATQCMLCMPMYFGFGLSILNLFLFPELQLTPMSLASDYNNIISELFASWNIKLIIETGILIVFDGLIAGGIVFLLDTLQTLFEKIIHYHER